MVLLYRIKVESFWDHLPSSKDSWFRRVKEGPTKYSYLVRNAKTISNCDWSIERIAVL